MRLGKLVRWAVAVSTLVVLATITATASTRLRDEAGSATVGGNELVWLPDATLLRPLGLGYDNVLADVLWFRTIDYFGAHYEEDRVYPWLAAMCDLVTDLDPRAEHVYRFAGLILPWEADEVDAGIRLLEKGLRTFPDSWRLHYFLGITHWVFRDDHVQAAEHLRQAAALPGAPPMVAGIAAAIHGRQGTPETTVAFLREMLDHADSPEMRAVIRERLRDATFRATAAQLERVIAVYQEQHGEAPTSLDMLVDAGLLPRLAPDPYGGSYEIDAATGTIRSSTGRTPRELQDSPRRLQMKGARAS